MAASIKTHIATYLKLNVSVGIGMPVNELSHIRQSSDQAKQALAMTYFEGLNRVVLYRVPEQRKDSESEWFTLQSEL